ncbi:DUF4174 domain-containing protein [Flagellimonas sp. S174]|uniref:DUF4174 domain-containing protein n=1 Tax=Flagellimonas sp. S174 TaxID=3410790 RepID=UPI003BF53F2B
MKTLLIIPCFLFTLGCFGQQLGDYQWKKRLIVLVSEETNTSEVKQQLKILKESSVKLQNRDIIVLQKHPHSQDLSTFSIDQDFRGVLLIGKDGGLKLKKPFIVTPNNIFDLVDSMPMRRAEIRRNNGY